MLGIQSEEFTEATSQRGAISEATCKYQVREEQLKKNTYVCLIPNRVEKARTLTEAFH